VAVPTIAGVNPASGPAGGRNLIIVAGTNFRLPSPPPAAGPTDGVLTPTVRVRLNGEDARYVGAMSATELRIEAPAYRGSAQADPIVSVGLEVANLDDIGVPIPGEAVTLPLAYAYLRPAQRAPRTTEDNQRYRYVVRSVLQLFRRQVHPNTRFANVSTDYADAGARVIKTATLPSITLEGPDFIRDDWRTTHHIRDEYDGGTGRFSRYWPPWTYILRFRLIGLSEHKLEAVALVQAILELFMRNGFLHVELVPSDPGQGREKFPMHVVDSPTLAPVAGDANLHVIKATFDVRGVDFELPEPFAAIEPVTEIEMEYQRKDDSPGVETTEF